MNGTGPLTNLEINSFLEIPEHASICLGFDFQVLKKNQLLFFFKPECFPAGRPDTTKRIFQLIQKKFEAYHLLISGAIMVPGEVLRKTGIMDAHYQYINTLSRGGSHIISTKEKEAILHHLGVDPEIKITILGGHEVLTQHPGPDEKELNRIWLQGKHFKLKSGFYYGRFHIGSEEIIIINGFHPQQLSYFTGWEKRILVLLLNSDTSWERLKMELTGETDPAKASPGSIRRDLLDQALELDLEDVSVSRNYVHLSAGPFEAMYETDNFFSRLVIPGYEIGQTQMGRLMQQANVPTELQIKALTNPVYQTSGGLQSLFSATENYDSLPAVEKYIALQHA